MAEATPSAVSGTSGPRQDGITWPVHVPEPTLPSQEELMGLYKKTLSTELLDRLVCFGLLLFTIRLENHRAFLQGSHDVLTAIEESARQQDISYYGYQFFLCTISRVMTELKTMTPQTLNTDMVKVRRFIRKNSNTLVSRQMVITNTKIASESIAKAMREIPLLELHINQLKKTGAGYFYNWHTRRFFLQQCGFKTPKPTRKQF